MLGVDLLPYHTLGKAKYAALGREYTWGDHARLSDEEVRAMAQIGGFVRAEGHGRGMKR